MLIKVGDYRINLTHVQYIVSDTGGVRAVMVSGAVIEVGENGDQLLSAWDKWAQFQNDAQAVNEWAIAENLKQIEAAQNKSGIVKPMLTMPRGRG